jgi:hypothetical protein
MPTITEKIGSRDQSVGGLMQPTRIPITLTVRYCDETTPGTTEGVYSDLAAAGYVIELNRPYGRPPFGSESGTQTPLQGFSASNLLCPGGNPGASSEGFEVTAYSIRRQTSGQGVFTVEIINEMVEFQQNNHALTIITPGNRQIRAYRVRPTIPPLSEDGTNGYTEDLVPGYADGTINSGDIGGLKVDINLQPIPVPIAQSTITLSFISRRPYYPFASTAAASRTIDPIYQYWTTGDGRVVPGKRLTCSNGTLWPIGTQLLSVAESVSLIPITGTWVRVDIRMKQDEHAHLEQFPFAVNGFQPQDTDRFPQSTGFKMVTAQKVGFMDPHPEIADIDLDYLPCNVLTLWQADFPT